MLANSCERQSLARHVQQSRVRNLQSSVNDREALAQFVLGDRERRVGEDRIPADER